MRQKYATWLAIAIGLIAVAVAVTFTILQQGV